MGDKSQRLRPRARRGFWWALAAIALLMCGVVLVIQVVGNEFGETCADSYSCKGFLLGGAECVELDDKSYCTVYCETDAECPDGWACRGANPTVLQVETAVVDEVCVPADHR